MQWVVHVCSEGQALFYFSLFQDEHSKGVTVQALNFFDSVFLL